MWYLYISIAPQTSRGHLLSNRGFFPTVVNRGANHHGNKKPRLTLVRITAVIRNRGGPRCESPRLQETAVKRKNPRLTVVKQKKPRLTAVFFEKFFRGMCLLSLLLIQN